MTSKVMIHNPEIRFCASCASVALQTLRFNPFPTREYYRPWDATCVYCGEGMNARYSERWPIHTLCHHDVIEKLHAICGGSEKLNNNPLLYELLLPFLTFADGLKLSIPNSTLNQYHYWATRYIPLEQRGEYWIQFHKLTGQQDEAAEQPRESDNYSSDPLDNLF